MIQVTSATIVERWIDEIEPETLNLIHRREFLRFTTALRGEHPGLSIIDAKRILDAFRAFFNVE